MLMKFKAFEIKISVIILIISKINYIRFIDTVKNTAINPSRLVINLEHLPVKMNFFLSKQVGFYNLFYYKLFYNRFHNLFNFIINISFNYDFYARNIPV